ncbi:MAG TPA: NAD(+) synthase [Deltaproteobacteria bacterium]|nr:NAD(+) synthase [Deltaproteobacteria bacterium]
MEHKQFFNLYHQGFIRVAVCIPDIKVADPTYNSRTVLSLIKEAAGQNAVMAITPELVISAYSNDDLFQQDVLLCRVLDQLQFIIDETIDIPCVIVVGAPLRVDYLLFNCAVVIYRGNILGISVKSYLPTYREYYELRQFSPAAEMVSTTIDLCGQKDIPIGADLLFSVKNIRNFTFYVEICEDVWVPIPPSSFAALAGATVICNLSASNITVGKSEDRHRHIADQSARCISAYLYSSAGFGESTTDLAWDSDAVIYELGTFLAESHRFSKTSQIIYADIDLDRLVQERLRMRSFGHNVRDFKKKLKTFRTIQFDATPLQNDGKQLPERDIPRFPYVPDDTQKRDELCYEAYNIQVHGLAKRLNSSGIENIVIGVSGGLDSTHALIVAAHTMDLLDLPRTNIKAYTMPGFATSDKTHTNARRLMEALGVESNEIDIRPSCMQMFKDIGHPYADGQHVYDVTFENIQAGERTSHLFRIANLRDALVIGTGDLSELALGWSTYGVGDHMSHYSINASVPKTLIQYLIRWVARRGHFGVDTSAVLTDILETEISPELIPGLTDDQPGQKSETTIGPYELQDFNTYYATRYGYLPSKIAFLAYCAWHDKTKGRWPDVPEDRRNEYSIGEIKRWLDVFLYRFFKTSQFKRSCIPNSPKVGSGGSLSPRGDYRAPSDSEATIWLEEAKKIPESDNEKQIVDRRS